MRAQILAVVFIGLLAGAQCQTCPVRMCFQNASELYSTVKEVDLKDMNSVLMNFARLIPQFNNVVASCGSLLSSVKKSFGLAAPQEGLGLDLACIAALAAGIDKIKALKGSYSGGLNIQSILTDLAALGQDYQNIKTACKLK